MLLHIWEDINKNIFQVECNFSKGTVEPQHLHSPSNKRAVETQIKVKLETSSTQKQKRDKFST